MKVVYDDSPALDAFGRLRVSQVTTQIDLKQIDDDLPLFIDKLFSAGASSSYSRVDASTTLYTTTSGSYAIAQTKQKFSYQTGKGAQFFMTFNDFAPQLGITKRNG